MSQITVTERFWAKVDKKGPDDCWEWLGGTFGNGYGEFWAYGAVISAHRMAWELTFGEIPKGNSKGDFCICHKCDNIKCVNPAHLFLSNSAGNVTDKVSKGRHARGVTQGPARLTEEAVREIRSSALSQRKLATKFGVHQATIFRVLHEMNWTHVR